VTYHDFTETTECSFWEITVDHCNSGIFRVIPNIHISAWFCFVQTFWQKSRDTVILLNS
jgi:hypothetical protein